MIEAKIIGELADFKVEGLTDLMWETMKVVVDPSIHQNFTKGGRPTKWAPLKKTGKPSHLRQSGALENSVRYFVQQDGNTIRGIERAGEGLPYARIHQFGGVIAHGTKPHPIPMPARPYMVLQDADIKKVVKYFGGRLVSFIMPKRGGR